MSTGVTRVRQESEEVGRCRGASGGDGRGRQATGAGAQQVSGGISKFRGHRQAFAGVGGHRQASVGGGCHRCGGHIGSVTLTLLAALICFSFFSKEIVLFFSFMHQQVGLHIIFLFSFLWCFSSQPHFFFLFNLLEKIAW